MELGLSLGESTKPLLFMDKPVQASHQLGLGFNTTLSIDPRTQPAEEELRVKHEENQSSEQHDEQVSNENHNHLQLDLLLHTPVVARSNLPWPPPSENGSSAEAAGSSKVLDVNRLPAAAAYDDEAEEGSSPNSAASSFQMDLRIYSRGRSLSGSGNCNGKRDQYSDGEAYDQRASSRASDEDDNGGVTRKKLRLSKEQSAFLEESFKEHSTLNPKQKLALANQLNLRPRQVEVWFQNRRARTKLKQTEVDCEYLKRCCQTLTEENRRLHKELQELRALKTNSNPFYMQLPATTLTMCPSCERVATNSTPATASTAAVAAAATAKAAIDTTTSKAIEFPIGKPRFYPFVHTQPHYPHQSPAS